VYEPPLAPELHLRTLDMAPESCVRAIISSM
jgi:hypothetical protein